MQFKDTHSLTIELIDKAFSSGINFNLVVMDNAFLVKKTTDHIEKQTHQKQKAMWISRLEKNRRIYTRNRWRSIQEYAGSLPKRAYRKTIVNGKVYWVFTKVLHISKLGRQRVVVSHKEEDLSDEPKFLVSCAKHCNAGRIIKDYCLRGGIETIHRDVKQFNGFEASQLRAKSSVENHLTMCIVTYWLLLRLSGLNVTMTFPERVRYLQGAIFKELLKYTYQKASEKVPFEQIVKDLRL